MFSEDCQKKLISDKKSFKAFLKENKIFGICGSDKSPGNRLSFFLPIKIAEIFDHYLEIKFSKPSYVTQNISYDDHENVNNAKLFLRLPTQPEINEWKEIIPDRDFSAQLVRKDLSFYILSVKKGTTIPLTEIDSSFKNSTFMNIRENLAVDVTEYLLPNNVELQKLHYKAYQDIAKT